ncbi:hypothetical protein ACP70R_001959 [Stipagrostis hirtigluma subsp. patula]
MDAFKAGEDDACWASFQARIDFFHVEKHNPDPLGWATVVVYTCVRSCDGGEGGYR